jgi:hypothetical protein
MSSTTLTQLTLAVLALALTALAPQAAGAGATRATIILAQAGDDDDGEDIPARRRGSGEDGDAPDDGPSGMGPLSGAGTGGLDIIDAASEGPAVTRPANAPKDAVVCLAGCDGPRGRVVYNKPRS